MVKPFIVINAKTYPQTTGEGALRLARACDEIIKNYDANIALAVQPFDLIPVECASTYVKIYAQHLDAARAGRNTGFLIPENIRSVGITGTILNHSEHKLSFKVLQETVKECKRNKMSIIICANTPAEAKKVAALKPDYIAVEPPQLIGGDVSVSSANPTIISRAVAALKGTRIPLLVGAGVATGQDTKVALELGAVGVLLASHVAKAKNPKKILKDLMTF